MFIHFFRINWLLNLQNIFLYSFSTDKNMRAEIITIGDELLIGQTVDTNSAWMGAELSRIGFDIYRITSVSDNKDEIIRILNEVTGRSDVVLITGGLGPTSDDITKPTLCEFFGTKLVTDARVLEMIGLMLQKRNFRMNENNRKQAEVPENCRVLYNASGTAPGMWFEKNRTIFVSMPGVPLEMKHIMTVHVLPDLHQRFSSQFILHKNIMTYGLPEARLAEVLSVFESELPESVKIAYLPSFGIIKLRLTGKGEDQNSITKEVADQVSKLYSQIPDLIYGEDEESMEMKVGSLLRERKATLSTAESCTGGSVARMITSVPGSSDYFKGSVIAYDNKVKTKLLNVPEEIISQNGAVSSRTVEAMARSAAELFGTTYSIATSGIAGPTGGTADKPVGTIWIAVAGPDGIFSEKFVFGNDRNINITRSSISALNLLRRQILNK
jgi:nicotinamide-nucleotide amidase